MHTVLQQRLHDPVDVAAVFSQEIITPRHIRWQDVRYRVERVNQRWAGRDGAILMRYFAVSAGKQAFKLAFNTKKLTWTLEEVYRA